MEVSSQQTQILDQERSILRRVLPIETILDIVANINLIDNLVRVLLQRRCEDDDFVVLGHEFDELNAAWSDEEKAVLAVVNIMN